MANQQYRKFLLTINRPDEKSITHETIQTRLLSLKSLKYFCCADEIGNETGTFHTHIFVIYENPKLVSTIKNKFPEAHIDVVKGTNRENRDYVFKEGKWKDSEKGITAIPDSRMEYGELPEDRQCCKPELGLLFDLIESGLSNYQIISSHPEFMFDVTHIDRCRLILRQEEYKDTWRNVEVTYIWGKTATGKSRYVMDKYGYSNVFRLTDYSHSYDTYNGEDVILWEEYSSSFRIQDALLYLDGYPLKLPARYSDKVACYTKVYITSNLPLECQYQSVQHEHDETWKAFLRRINKVIHFKSTDTIITYDSVEDYMNRERQLETIPIQEQIPFD